MKNSAESDTFLLERLEILVSGKPACSHFEKQKSLSLLLANKKNDTTKKEDRVNPYDCLNEMKSLCPKQVCQYQFKSNDIVWICRDCQQVTHSLFIFMNTNASQSLCAESIG
jgi:hypothetical protein